MNEPELTWRPMSEAPRDGTVIAARWENAGPLDEPEIVRWGVDGWYLVNMDDPLADDDAEVGFDAWRELRDVDLSMLVSPVELLNALGHDNPTPTYEPVGDDRVPMERWGQDHWSTLGYLECRIVDHKGRIAHDHMRCHIRRHPAMHAAKRRSIAFGPADGSQYPTRLRDGELPDHDDYDCVDDMIAAGLVTVTMPEAPAGTPVTGLVEAELMTRATYALTERGLAIAGQLRAHKGNGEQWRNFTPEVPSVTDDLIAISLPGVVDQIMKDGSYPQDEPERWQRYRARRTIRNIGANGFAAIVVLSRDDWRDVLDYLDGYLGCVAGMTSSERGEGGKTEIRALRVAVKRIGVALDGEPRG